MNQRPAKLLLLGAILLAPGLAGALELGAHAGLLYRRTDITPPEGPASSFPELTIDLGARASSTENPLLQWSLDGAYQRLRSELDGTPVEAKDTFQYGASLRVLDPKRSPAYLSLTAAQSNSENDRGSGGALVSTTSYRSFGGTLGVMALRPLPLTLDASTAEGEESIPGYPTHTHERTAFTVSAVHGDGPAPYRATYTQAESSGSWVSDQYEERKVIYSVHADPARELRFDVSGGYEERTPTTSATGAWGAATHGFRATLQGPDRLGERVSLAYRYTHATVSTPGSPSPTSILQGATFEQDLRVTDRVVLRPLLDLSMSELRLGADDTRATGETVGAQLWWRSSDSWPYRELRAGPLVSLLQPESGANRVGYGATLGARVGGLEWRGVNFNVNYDADYGNDLYGAEGWSLRQSLTGGADGRSGRLRYGATATAGASRTWAPLLGDGATRILTAEVRLGTRDRELSARVSHQSGTVGAATDFVGDGLLIPAPFDSRSTAAMLRHTERLTRWLHLYAAADVNVSNRPGQPSLEQYGGSAGITIPYGAFTFTAEDRVLLSETPSGWLRNNMIIVRAWRTIGARY